MTSQQLRDRAAQLLARADAIDALPADPHPPGTLLRFLKAGKLFVAVRGDGGDWFVIGNQVKPVSWPELNAAVGTDWGQVETPATWARLV